MSLRTLKKITKNFPPPGIRHPSPEMQIIERLDQCIAAVYENCLPKKDPAGKDFMGGMFFIPLFVKRGDFILDCTAKNPLSIPHRST